MTTAADLVASLSEQSAKDVPEVIEIPMNLHLAAYDNHRNQYRGRTDAAGTARVRVYIGGDVEEHAGEIIAGTVKDITKGSLTGRNKGLALFEYRDTVAPNTLVMVWVPKDAAHKGIKLTL
ncbi:MAG: hypothetical protein ABFR89_02585 [Actinomycetota bacterium]